MKIETEGNISKKEIDAYIRILEDRHGRKVKSLKMKEDRNDRDFLDVEYEMEDVKFERIRRITGYLVGTMDKWNDAKTAEEKDRVSHFVSGDVKESEKK